MISMNSPQKVKEVQRLTRCLAALGRFLSRSGDKNIIEWTYVTESAFAKLKDHLHTLPRLVSTVQGETLYMYLAISEHALSAILLTERGGIQHPVYFIIEKFGLTLFMANKKLRLYFLAHKLIVYTDQPLKQPLFKFEAAGRRLK